MPNYIIIPEVEDNLCSPLNCVFLPLQNVYVREGIFPDVRQGLDWLLVSGMTAIALSVSDVTVWALSAAGQIYKRIGITENNYIGEAW